MVEGESKPAEAPVSRAGDAPVSTASPDGSAAPTRAPLSLSGVVNSYTPATAQQPGTISVGGLPFPIASGTTLTGDSIEPGLRVNLDARLDSTGRIVAGTARREEVLEGEKPSWARFTIELAYLVVLIAGALVYHDVGHDAVIKPMHDFLVNLFPDPIGAIPLSIPWLGALGSVARGLANSYGEVDFIQRSPYRPRHYNTLGWYIARPFIGAAFGIFVFTFFLAILDPTGKSKPGGEYGMDILAFIIGYADGTFAALVQRAINVLLGPGDPGAQGGMESSPSTPSMAGVGSGPSTRPTDD